MHDAVAVAVCLAATTLLLFTMCACCAAGAVLLHLWTQSLELKEIEHILQDYVDRKKKNGQQVGPPRGHAVVGRDCTV